MRYTSAIWRDSDPYWYALYIPQTTGGDSWDLATGTCEAPLSAGYYGCLVSVNYRVALRLARTRG